jgi:hypothetical protein
VSFNVSDVFFHTHTHTLTHTHTHTCARVYGHLTTNDTALYIHIDELLCWKGLQVIEFKVTTPACLAVYCVEQEITYFSLSEIQHWFRLKNQLISFHFTFTQSISDMFMY